MAEPPHSDMQPAAGPPHGDMQPVVESPHGDRQPVAESPHRASQTGATGAACAARLDDGRQIFVRDVPRTLPVGAVLRCRFQQDEVHAVVSIPPALLLYLDPSIETATFAALVEQAAPAAVAAAPEPLASLRWADAGTLLEPYREMLTLAYEERHRLDDPGDYPERRPTRDRR